MPPARPEFGADAIWLPADDTCGLPLLAVGVPQKWREGSCSADAEVPIGEGLPALTESPSTECESPDEVASSYDDASLASPCQGAVSEPPPPEEAPCMASASSNVVPVLPACIKGAGSWVAEFRPCTGASSGASSCLPPDGDADPGSPSSRGSKRNCCRCCLHAITVGTKHGSRVRSLSSNQRVFLGRARP